MASVTHRGMGIVREAWGIVIVIGVFIEGECLRHETREDYNANKSEYHLTRDTGNCPVTKQTKTECGEKPPSSKNHNE